MTTTKKELMADEQRTTEPSGAKKPQKRAATPAQRAAGRENLLAFREPNPSPALTHGLQSAAVRAGRLPKGHAKLQKLVDRFYSEWISDLGGAENLTGSKRAILWVARGCLAVFVLGLEHVKNNGFVDGQGNVADALKVMMSAGNSLRLHLAAVGLERIARRVGPETLEEYIDMNGPAPVAEECETGKAVTP
jgi:hypothetical protein